MQKTILEINGLNFSYKKGAPTLINVNLQIKEKDFVALIGPNGGGKSTLLKAIAGIIKTPAGVVKINGNNLRANRGRIGYVPQDTSLNKDFPITALDVTKLGLLGKKSFFKSYTPEQNKQAEEALRLVDMWEYRDKKIGEMSGGQRQRVLIARALAASPDIMLLDEPTASVDKEGQTRLYEILKELNKKITVIIVSHDLGVVSSYIKSIACVNRNVYFHDSPSLTEEMIENVFGNFGNGNCPIELVAHGVPHRVLPHHHTEEN